MNSLSWISWFLAGWFLGFIGIAIFISGLSRLTEWASGGSYRRSQEIIDARNEAERWKKRYTDLLDKQGKND